MRIFTGQEEKRNFSTKTLDSQRQPLEGFYIRFRFRMVNVRNIFYIPVFFAMTIFYTLILLC